MRSVTLVAGPPCSGKSTWVAERARRGDLILDADDIARRLGSPRRWLHAEPWRSQAQNIMDQQMRRVAHATAGTAWVIRSVPEPHARASLARGLRADRVVVLLPGLRVLMGRSRARPDPRRTAAVIRQWLGRYAPCPLDELIV